MKRLLVVDDDAHIREAFREAAAGRFTVRAVPGGDAALAHLAAAPVDIVLIDLQMPGRDGAETILEARRRGVDAAFVLMSADVRAPELARALGVPCLVKPFGLEELERTLADASP